MYIHAPMMGRSTNQWLHGTSRLRFDKAIRRLGFQGRFAVAAALFLAMFGARKRERAGKTTGISNRTPIGKP